MPAEPTPVPSEQNAPVVIVYLLAHAVAALSAAAGRPVIMASAAQAGIYAGAGWFTGVMAAARAAVPEARATALLDCGDDSGAAMAAIAVGVDAVVFTGPAAVAARLSDIARQSGVRLLTERPPPALDLAAGFFAGLDDLRARCAALWD